MKTNPGHEFMSFTTDATGRTLYPDPHAGAVTSPINGFGFSTTAGDSPFSDADTECVLYSISATTTANETITIQDHAGNEIAAMSCGSSRISSNYDFGPEGIRLKDGFRIVTGGSADASFILVYDVA